MDRIRVETSNVNTERLEQRIRGVAPDVWIDFVNLGDVTEAKPHRAQITLIVSSALSRQIAQVCIAWAKETNVWTKVLDHKGSVIREVGIRSN
jgi:hypothetical protein